MTRVLDPEAMAALEGAVEAAPSSIPLRLTLVTRMEDGAHPIGWRRGPSGGCAFIPGRLGFHPAAG